MSIIVRYIGPGEAILAGTYIQQDETRTVTPAQLQAAQEAHPAGFLIIAGDDTPEPQLSQGEPQTNDQVDLREPAEIPADTIDLSEPAAPAPRRRQRQHGGA